MGIKSANFTEMYPYDAEYHLQTAPLSMSTVLDSIGGVMRPDCQSHNASLPARGESQDCRIQNSLFAQLQMDSLANSPWDYHQQSYRYGLHGLIRYPAMMVPQMQGDLLDAALRVKPTIKEVLDPFVGAGTTLIESRSRGLNFTGIDINPLAILACQAKSGPLRGEAYAMKARALLKKISLDNTKSIDANFPEQSKWFSASASIQLSRIRRGIQGESSLWARRLMWLAFAETVRAVSNSRTSTYKLHIRPADELEDIPCAIEHFRDAIDDSVNRVIWHEAELTKRNMLQKGKTNRSIATYCGSISEFSLNRGAFADLIITSPPYGDNRSTVSYGQFSYLQLRWIPDGELPLGIASFQNAYAVDGRSLGGRLKGSLAHIEHLSTLSVATRNFISELRVLQRRDLLCKSLAFLHDYERALISSVGLLHHGGYAIWTIGDRRVGGVRLPLGEITGEILESVGMRVEGNIQRTIPKKRTPQRNSQGFTMNDERVLITTKI